MTLKRLAAKITIKNAHLITLSDEKSGTMLFRALKTVFVEKKEQSGPLSVKPKANVSSAICQLSVNPIQTVSKAWIKTFGKKMRILFFL